MPDSSFTVKLVNPPSDLIKWSAVAQDADVIVHYPADGVGERGADLTVPLTSPMPTNVFIWFWRPAWYTQSTSGMIDIPDGSILVYDFASNSFYIEQKERKEENRWTGDIAQTPLAHIWRVLVYDPIAKIWVAVYTELGDPVSVPKIPLGQGVSTVFYPSNDSQVQLKAHIDLTINKPDGSVVSPSPVATLNQDVILNPAEKKGIAFAPFILDVGGTWRATAVLSVENIAAGISRQIADTLSMGIGQGGEPAVSNKWPLIVGAGVVVGIIVLASKK